MTLYSLRFITGVLLLGTLLTVSACAQSEAEAPAPEAPQVLIVGGGSSHDFDRWFNEADVAFLDSVGIQATYTDVPGRVESALENQDVLYLTNNQELPGQELRDAIFHFVNSGRGLMIGHAAGWYNWSDWPAYNRDLVGGGTRSHFAYGDFEVIVEDPEHPIMQGVPATFTITDELYRFERDEESPPIHVLATGRNPETGDSYPVVWIVHNTNGRVVVNTLGHDGAAHEHPAYRTILENSVRWTGRALN